MIAARKVGRILNESDSTTVRRRYGRGGHSPSQRGELRRALGLSGGRTRDLLRLGRLPDPEFQRYIQLTDRIPSIHGCLVAHHAAAYAHTHSPGWRKKRRERAGVKKPANPSLDEGYSLIVKALGHLTASRTDFKGQRDLGQAIDHLYAAEDLLKPYRGGYAA